MSRSASSRCWPWIEGRDRAREDARHHAAVTLCNWVLQFEVDRTPSALTDRRRTGRPTKWTEPVRRFLSWSLEQPPDALGYAVRNIDGPTAARARGALDGGLRVGLHNGRRAAPARLSLEASALRASVRPRSREKKRRIRQQIRDLPKGTLVLAQAETDVMLFTIDDPLRRAPSEGAGVWTSRPPCGLHLVLELDAGANQDASEGNPDSDTAGISGLLQRLNGFGRRDGLVCWLIDCRRTRRHADRSNER